MTKEFEYPQDETAEKEILCAAVIYAREDHEFTEQILSGLTDKSFNETIHRKIFKILQSLYENGKSKDGFDLRMIDAEMKDKTFQMQDFISNIYLSGQEIPKRIELLKNYEIRRAIIKLSKKIIETAVSDTNAVGLLSDLEAEVIKLHELRVDKKYREFNELIDEQMEIFKREKDSVNVKKGIYPGLPDLEWRLEPGRLYLIAGRPSHGKSTLALQICKTVAFETNQPVVYVSLEETDSQIAERALLNQFGEPRFMANAKWDELEKHADILKQKCKLIIVSEPKLDIGTFRTDCRKFVSQNKVPIICIDYLQLMRGYPFKKYRSEVEEITEISRGLKQIAIELNIPVLAVSQLNREADSRGGWRPQLSDLRGSGSLEQDADVVVLVFRQECYEPHNALVNKQIELITVKNRSGKIGSKVYSFDGSCYKITSKNEENSKPDDYEPEF